MAFIEVIPPNRATGETAEAYRYMSQVGGSDMVAKIVQVFSLRPSAMRMMVRRWELAMWVGDEPRQMREMVAAAVSRFNNCHY
ncbi:MAG: carboxymuconolactone decarboxylase family protein [Deltaproteobacteria bacterium]|nr:carboxymuconolactone decarboxylase family protein [Deltaproteobacteria bacterium]